LEDAWELKFGRLVDFVQQKPNMWVEFGFAQNFITKYRFIDFTLIGDFLAFGRRERADTVFGKLVHFVQEKPKIRAEIGFA
jgi:hypothetical protein